MGYNWKILRAAVEQEILFPSRKAFIDYCDALWDKGLPYQVMGEVNNEDGTVTAIMRKRYNPQNEFFAIPVADSYTGEEEK